MQVFSRCAKTKKGNIWGGTNNGIFCFTPSENKFVNYFPLDSRISNTILNILCDKDGTIWAAGWINLLKFNQESNKFENVVRVSGYDSARQYSMRQNCLLMDPSGEGFWMATRTGMFYYNTKTNELNCTKQQMKCREYKSNNWKIAFNLSFFNCDRNLHFNWKQNHITYENYHMTRINF